LTLVFFFKGLEVALALLEELAALERSTHKLGLEKVPSPLNAVVEKVREVLEGTERDPFLWGIRGVTVGLGLEGNDDLRVALGAEGSRLKEWLLVENTFRVNVFSGLEIVQSVQDAIKILPEVVVEQFLGVRGHSNFVGFDIQVWVHFESGCSCDFGL
jgi:hypothetical protein